jgi:fructosamine-3-kinase
MAVSDDINRICREKGFADPVLLSPLSGGCVGDVFAVSLSDGSRLVAKVGDLGSGLEIEGAMLDYLSTHSALPVPQVISADDSLLLMTQLPASGRLDQRAQRHAADLVAALHDVTWPSYGFEWDTLIGGLHQPNPSCASWLEFFRDHRLLYMGRQGLEAGRLPARTFGRLEKLADSLDRWLSEPARPSLLHGDMWGGNVLCDGGKISGFIDPALYYGDSEIELAFSTLFGTYGDAFFERYAEHRPIAPGFFEERRDLYNLYPLLVHVRLFGGSYLASVEGTLSRFGF